ncbi:MAG: methylmalonyl-CoA mutase family protein, partial [Actinomycetota bacterium]|nr:methylmalonyl-CoA mutase family protein [Actinomycetota bacterium]
LPAWNEALGLPRAWDQQWSLRAQQILAFETDLLEYEDIFDGSKIIDAKTDEISSEAWAELNAVIDAGGSVAALDHMKEQLVAKHAERRRAIETGERTVVGLNAYEATEPSPLVAGMEGAAFEEIDPASEQSQIERLEQWRAERDAGAADHALDALRRAAASDDNLIPASIAAARAGVTTGEWADALRATFGEYRAPTGLGAHVTAGDTDAMAATRAKVAAAEKRLGVKKLRLLVAKPGLDGHSNAAEQVAVRARDAGMEVIYQGIRLTPAEIARAATDEDAHVVALSILSGAHGWLVPEVLDRLRAEGVTAPVVVGGVIPDGDAEALRAAGVSRVYTPRDYDLTTAIGEIADLVHPG